MLPELRMETWRVRQLDIFAEAMARRLRRPPEVSVQYKVGDGIWKTLGRYPASILEDGFISIGNEHIDSAGLGETIRYRAELD